MYTLSPLVPGPTLETFVGADINTILITNLLSGMDYNVKIFASQAAGFSDALTGLVKTCKTNVHLLQPHSWLCCLVFPVTCNSTPASSWPLAFLFLSVAHLDGISWKERCTLFSWKFRVLVGRWISAPGFQIDLMTADRISFWKVFVGIFRIR
jgi:hypothetical protein